MSATVLVLLVIATLGLIGAAAVIAAAETAFTRVNRSRADALVAAEAEDHAHDDDADDRVEELQVFSRSPMTMLSSLTFVQVSCQFGAAGLSFAIGRELAGRTAGYIGVGICMVVLFSAVGLSRSRALLAPDTTAVGLVPILKAVAPLGAVTGLIARLADRSSSAPLPDPDVDEQQVLAIVGQTSGIDHEEEEMIKRVVAFDDTLVVNIMTPRTDMVTLRSGFAVGDALEVATLHGLSRIPVTGTNSDIDDIIGAVHVKDLIGAHLDGKTASDIDIWLREAPVVPETQRIANLLVGLTPDAAHTGPDGEPFRSGFVSFVGRPNAGKSTLLNNILGSKVAIVSNKPQTTRTQVRGVLHRPGLQVVFVDTPGIHKAVSPLGTRLNDSATATIGDVDVTCLVIDGLAPFGRGDQYIADKMPKNSIVIINKVDRANREQVLTQLAAASELEFAEYFPVSAKTGEGVDALVEYLVGRIPEGPPYYPEDMLSDVPEPTQVAELVREQLFIHTRQELPYSIATRVTEWEWPRIRCEILVERDSQKGMVIGKGGSLLKRVGIAVREQLPEGTFIELHVTVDKDWQRKIDRIEQLGYGES